MENVDAVLNKKNLPEFNRWIGRLREMGYTSSYAVLNAKDYGVPQSRKRCFMVSTLKGQEFQFPEPCPDGRVLKDVLEDDVPESFYLSEEKVATYERHRIRHEAQGHGLGWPPSQPMGMAYALGTKHDRPNQNFVIEVVGNIKCSYESTGRVYSDRGLGPSICTYQGGGQVPMIEQEDTTLHDNDLIPDMEDGEVVAMLTPGRMVKRQNGKRCKTDGLSFTVTVADTHGIAELDGGRLRIRYLTPRECWRLMGFPDEAFDRAQAAPTSKTQLYKQAGNSIAVPCLKAIFKGMYIDNTWRRVATLEEWCR